MQHKIRNEKVCARKELCSFAAQHIPHVEDMHGRDLRGMGRNDPVKN
jgi:hypothetical protein